MIRVTRRPPRRLAAASIAIAALALACGGQDSPAPAPDPAAEAAESAPESAGTAETSGGAADAGRPLSADDLIITEAVVPETFPGDVPLYPDAAPGSAMVVPGLGMFMTFVTDDEPSAVYEHFRSGLGENGWSLSDSPDAGIDGSKEGRTVQVRARPNESGQTEIAINIDES